MAKKQLSRRAFLQRAGLGGLGVALAATGCQPKTVVVEKEVEVEKEVTRVVKETIKETVVVEGTPKVVEKEVTKVVKETVVVEVPPVAPEPVEIKWWYWSASDEPGPVNTAHQNAFMERHPDIKLGFEMVAWDGYREKIFSMIAAGTPPDFFQVPGGDTYVELAEQDALLDVTDMVLEMGLQEEEFALQGAISEVEGHYYGLAPFCHGFAIYYNAELFDELGVKTPNDYAAEGTWDWNTFLEACQALSTGPEDARETFGFLVSWADWKAFIWGAGGDIVDDIKHTTKILIDSAEAVEGLQFAQDLRYKYKVAPTPEQQQATPLWDLGKLGMLYNGTWGRIGSSENLDYRWDVGPFPLHPTHGHPFQYANYAVHAIPKGTAQQEAGIKLLKYEHSLEAQRIWAEAFDVMPINKTIASSDAFVRAGEAYGVEINARVFLVGMESPKLDSVDPNFSRVWSEVVNPEMDLFWNGELSAKEFADKVVPEANKQLSGG